MVIGYYLQNKEAVERYLHEQQALAKQARDAFETEFANDALRARLVRRLEEKRE